MNIGTCTLCLTTNPTNIINNTYLQPIYEKLVDLKVDSVSCWLCFICHRRLQQCHRLFQLAEHTRPILISSILGVQENMKEEIFESSRKKALLQLSSSQQINISIASTDCGGGEDSEIVIERELLNEETDERAACSGSDEQSSKLSSCDEYEDSIQDVKDFLEVKYDEQPEEVRRESEDMKEEYMHTNMTSAAEDSKPVTGIIFNEDMKNSEEMLQRPKANSEVHTDEKMAIYNCNCKFDKKCRLHRHLYNQKRFSCDVCQRKFSAKRFLQSHLKLHTDERPFNCDICQSKFTVKRSLQEHLRRHTGEKPYNCDICQCKFTVKRSLQEHLRCHTDDKPYDCHICHRKFPRRRCFQEHLRSHTGEKPYSCDICQRKFAVKRSLNVHIRTHSDEKRYKCNICDSQFTQNHNLQEHLRRHTGVKPYNCEICQRKFSEKRFLQNHLKLHTNEKPFNCDICQRKFSQKYYLQNHLRNHTGEKPFDCNICPLKFSTKRCLQKHLKKHTDEKPFSC